MKLESLHPDVLLKMYGALENWQHIHRGEAPAPSVQQCWEDAWLSCLDMVADRLAPLGLTL